MCLPRRALAPFAAAALLAAAPPTVPKDALRTALQAELVAFLGTSSAPGATLAVALPSGEVITVAAGKADRERGEAMTPAHRMLSGSVGKTCVAAIILQLVEEGRLSLEDPLSRFFGKAGWFPRLPNASSLRIRHLLAHTSGIGEYVEQPALWEAVQKAPDHVWIPEERLAYVLDAAPPFAPGQGFAYADTNYILLGMVIEQVSGGTYEEALRRRILEPLGLRDTVPSDRRSLPGLAAGYAQLPAYFRMPPKVAEGGRYAFNPQLEWTGGGLACTASDLARWAKALFEGKVLSPASIAAMTRAGGPETDFPDGAQYGLGCILWRSDFGASYGHSGFAPGYNAIVEYLPGRRMAFALQCNADTGLRRAGASPHQALARFLRIALAQVP